MQSIEKTGIEVESFNSFPAIASHVTAYARMLLWGFKKIAGHENVFYCDTDSLFVNKRGLKRLEKSGCIDGKRLGSLGIEKSGFFEIRGLKDYTLIDGYDYGKKQSVKNIDKIKGISLKGLNDGSTIKLSENEYIVTQWPGVSKFIASGGVGKGYKNRLQLKKLSREYSKGRVKKSGKVEPYYYEEE